MIFHRLKKLYEQNSVIEGHVAETTNSPQTSTSSSQTWPDYSSQTLVCFSRVAMWLKIWANGIWTEVMIDKPGPQKPLTWASPSLFSLPAGQNKNNQDSLGPVWKRWHSLHQLDSMNGLREESPPVHQDHPPWTAQWVRNTKTSIVFEPIMCFGSACYRSLCYPH